MKVYAVETMGEHGYYPIGLSDCRSVAEEKCKEMNKEIQPFYPFAVTEYTIGKSHWTVVGE